MDRKAETKLSKFLSLILRHNPGVIGLELDQNGWANVEELIQKCSTKGKNLDLNILKQIVRNDNKQRYSFNGNFSKIRANQGHSINIDLELQAQEPPEFLFHGTADRNIESIMANGLKKRNRNHVHLSLDVETAKKVGMRHGKVVVLQIKTGEMHRKGHKFYLSENKVWLTDFVEPEFIEVFRA